MTLRAQLAEQSSTLLDQHPRIKELKAQIGDLERQIRAEGERLVRALENDAKVADARVNALSANLDLLKRQAASNNEQDVQLRALEREAKSQRDLLESYLAKYREATARDSLGAASADARIISAATVSNTPAWPKKLPTVLVATLAMFGLSCGFILTGELLHAVPISAGIATVAPAGPAAGPTFVAAPSVVPSAAPTLAPTLAPAEPAAVIPAAPPPRDIRNLIAKPEPAPAIQPLVVPIETIEALAGELSGLGEGSRRITVVGATRKVGTTFAAITLARSLAKKGRVVLVDLALGAPNLAAIATETGAPGITDLVQGSASFGQIITRDRFSRVHLVMAGRTRADADDIIGSQRLSITIEALARSYDHVVIDAGALPDMAADRFAQISNRAILVASTFDDPLTVKARERLLAAGFSTVSVLVSTPRSPESSSSKARVAA